MIEEELRNVLQEVAGEVQPYGRPERVIARAKRRVAGTAAVLVLVAAAAGTATVEVLQRVRPVSDVRLADEMPRLVVTPEPGTPHVEAPLEDQAVVFAIRALAGSGLLEPLGAFYGFESVGALEGAWRVGFSASECGRWEGPRGTYETCKPLSGFGKARTGIEDSWLEVVLQDGAWHVTAVDGKFPAGARDELMAFSLPRADEEPHWEFPTPRLDLSEQEGGTFRVRATSVWVGPIPFPGPGSRCQTVALDENGGVLGRETPAYRPSPNEEWERAGGMLGTGVRAHPGIASVRIECRMYDGTGWRADAVELTTAESDPTRAIVHATLLWEDEGLTLAQSTCVAGVYDSGGVLLGSSTQRIAESWPPSRAEEPPPYRAERIFTVRVDDAARAASAEVSCKLS